jgi:hypothetical protein
MLGGIGWLTGVLSSAGRNYGDVSQITVRPEPFD